MARYPDEWDADDEARGVGDYAPHPEAGYVHDDGPAPYTGAGENGVEADQDDPPYDDEPETDAEGNPIEQVVEPATGGGDVHAHPPPHGDGLTPCCGRRPADLPDGDTLSRDPDAVRCGVVGAATGDPNGYSDEYQHEPGSDVEPRQPTATEIEQGMRAYARAVRDENAEHAHHDGDPTFDPERGVVCGCGEIVPEGPDGSGYEPMRGPDNLPGTPAADPVMTDLPAINPRAHYTPADVERSILETVRRLDAGLALEAQWIEVHDRAREKLDKAAARARLRVRGGAKDVRDAEVRVACEREYADVAEARLRCEVIKASMHSLRSVLSGYQSVGRSLGVLVQAGGGDGQPPYRRDRDDDRQGGRR